MIGLMVPFAGFVIYFISISIYVVVKLYLVNNEIKNVERQTENVSREITANNDLLKKFILSKHVLVKIESLNKTRFPYKEYLDKMISLLPPSVVLKNVDFSKKNWIAATVSVPSLVSLKTLEESLSDSDLLATTPFVSIFSEGVNRDKSGLYSVNLQFEINNNAGK